MPLSHLPKGGGDPGWLSFLMIVVLAVWGGLINYLSRVRSADKTFSWGELLFESAISAFAGTQRNPSHCTNSGSPVFSSTPTRSDFEFVACETVTKEPFFR